MKIIGFQFTKISGERMSDNIKVNPSTSIEFSNVEEESFDLLKDNKAVSILFKYSVKYDKKEDKEEKGEDKEDKKENPLGEIRLEGKIVLSVSEEDSKNILKSWKKKQLPPNLNLFLFNTILRKCTPKAIYLEDEINLPIHTPMPKLKTKEE